MATGVTDDHARTMRRMWFDYLETIEPLRSPLHAYGMRLTGNVWDAEDLVQETLLKGFGMIGRGDLHGAGGPVANVRAYLFRTATHVFIDGERRKARDRAHAAEIGTPPATSTPPPTSMPDDLREAGRHLFTSASPQARAAFVLKDVFGFSLEEIADQLHCSVGAVKSALHRARAGLRDPSPTARTSPPRALIDAFVEAYNAKDLDRLLAVLTENPSIEVLGVGGGRGLNPDNGWAQWILSQPVHAYTAELDGETVVAILFTTPKGARLCEVLRLQGEDDRIGRIIDYCYAADTLAYAARALGYTPLALGYRQDEQTLRQMIATTTRPWDSEGIAAPAPPPPA